MSDHGGRERRGSLLVLAPAIAAACVVVLLIATMLGLSALVGGAAAQGGCVPGAVPVPGAGAPPELQPIFEAAARRYRLGRDGPAILAGLTEVESGFGRNMGPSSAGAIGWTQFMPATWESYGVDANHDGRRDPYTAEDAIFAAARYLRASGAPRDWYRALFAYNHADWYVREVLEHAKRLSGLDAIGDGGPGSVLVIGDSLEVGTYPELRRLVAHRLTGDFESGRSSTTGIAVLRRMLRTGDYDAILFDLGTNDGDVAQFRRSLSGLAELAGDRRVYVATVNSPYDERAKNDSLAAYAHARPNVRLIRWHEASQRFELADGIHGAYGQRARVVADALGDQPAAAESCASAAGPGTGAVHTVTGPAGLVPIPGQNGQTIDARILPDVISLIDTYHLTITAGYAATGHAADGEHPLGLALDIVPGPGGTWDDVDRLARWAEPVQNAPRPPFRWVGYDGDANHGRGNHLHLSWNHSPTPSRRPPAASVDVFGTMGEEQ
ncbi:MAG: lytic murein transglycosylase [Solirubrobacteraceae bacterium]